MGGSDTGPLLSCDDHVVTSPVVFRRPPFSNRSKNNDKCLFSLPVSAGISRLPGTVVDDIRLICTIELNSLCYILLKLITKVLTMLCHTVSITVSELVSLHTQHVKMLLDYHGPLS